MHYNAIFEKCEEGGYTVIFPDITGCITDGNTLEEAEANAHLVLNEFLSIESFGVQKPTLELLKTTNITKKIDVNENIAIALKLRWARLEANLTLVDIAKKLDISYQSYQRLENPRKSNITFKTLQKLENVLNQKLVQI